MGGGGGNAGSGSGSTHNGTSGSTALKLALTLGGIGAGGGTVGEVIVTTFAGTSIQTYGDGAIGIFAESVGGGGGNSGGGSFQLGLPSLDEQNGVFRSVVDLQAAINRSIDEHNQTRKPSSQPETKDSMRWG